MEREAHLKLQREWYQRKNSDTAWKASRNQLRAQQRRDNKTKAVDFFGRKCHDCNGVWQEDCVYDFHHLDIHKDSVTPSHILHCGWETIMKELASCVLLCSNFHRIRHSLDGYSHHSKRAGKAKY